MSLPPGLLRELMRGVPAPVGVLVTRHGSGYRGMTASSMTSVCLEPPLISFNVRRGSQFDEALQTTGEFTYNLLAADQEEVAAHFARPGVSADDQFASVSVNRHDSGGLWLDGVVSWMHTRQIARHLAGDHAVIIGEVVAAGRSGDAMPLIIYQGALRPIGDG